MQPENAAVADARHRCRMQSRAGVPARGAGGAELLKLVLENGVRCLLDKK